MHTRRIELSPPQLGEDEKQALAAVIDDNWLAMGRRVEALEHEFAALHNVSHAVAVNSCTAALHLAVEAYGIGPQDEVIVPSLSFVATANAVLQTGADVVFADIESLKTPHMCLKNAKEKLSSRTKAVIALHYGGYLQDLHPWRSFCDENGLILIEDAAHAAGLEGVAQASHASAFSFYSNKNMTTGEGGMLLVHDQQKHDLLLKMRSHGMTSTTLTRDEGHAYGYDVVTKGYNYRMDELRAAIGLQQVKKLKARNRLRVHLANTYRTLFSADKQIEVPFCSTWEQCGHIMPVLLPKGTDRLSIMSHLRSIGIQSSIHYRPIHTLAKFEDYRNSLLPLCEEYGQRVLTLPLHPGMTEEDVEYVVANLKKSLSAVR